MRTLHLRVRESCESALWLAEQLQENPHVAEVLYPGLPSFAGHEVAKRQMHNGFGGMLSIRLKGGAEQAIKTAARTRLWKRATSLGGVESLIEHRASIEGEGTPVPDDLLRLSVGIEYRKDLLRDLEQAFQS
jgi:cystathionine gamma-synthase